MTLTYKQLIGKLEQLGTLASGKLKCKLDISGDLIRVHVHKKDLAAAAKLLAGVQAVDGKSLIPCCLGKLHEAPGIQPEGQLR